MLFCFSASPKTFLTFPFVPKSKRFAPESFGGGSIWSLDSSLFRHACKMEAWQTDNICKLFQKKVCYCELLVIQFFVTWKFGDFAQGGIVFRSKGPTAEGLGADDTIREVALFFRGKLDETGTNDKDNDDNSNNNNNNNNNNNKKWYALY